MLSPDFAQSTHVQENSAEFVTDPITELLRTHARTLIKAALEVEVASVVAELKANGADVIRNGYLPERIATRVDG